MDPDDINPNQDPWKVLAEEIPSPWKTVAEEVGKIAETGVFTTANVWEEELQKTPFYVVAGSYDQYKNYLAKKKSEAGILRMQDLNDYRYVSHADELRGLENIKGAFYGTWKDRKDIEEIKTAIAISKSRKARQEMTREAAIQQSSDELAKLIDAEVLKQSLAQPAISPEFLKALNGGFLNEYVTTYHGSI